MTTGLKLHPQTVGVRLPEDLMFQLLDQARREGIPVAVLVRRAAMRGLSTPQSVREHNIEVTDSGAESHEIRGIDDGQPKSHPPVTPPSQPHEAETAVAS